MSNTEWEPLRAGEYTGYSVWGEDVYIHDTFEEEEEEYDEETTDEEEEREDYSTYEEMFADLPIHSASIVADTMKLSVSPPRITIADGVSITFNHSDKATVTQEVVDGQLSLTIEENTDLQSIKICVNNRTWVIPLDTLPLLPPSMPKKR